jgi:hypothetical protein
LPLKSVDYLTAVSDPGETSLDAIEFGDQYLHAPFDTSRILTGGSLFDTQVRTEGVKVHWLPVSLYYVPVIMTNQYVYTPQPAGGGTEAPSPTTVTYARYAVYGVISANATHLFDFQAEPLKTEHPRAGIGLLWAHRQADRQADQSSAGTKKNPLAVRMQGVELSRSTNGGETIWYFSYVRALEQSIATARVSG